MITFLWAVVSLMRSPCAWRKISAEGTTYEMCLRKASDVVSDSLKSTGRWPDCMTLVRMYRTRMFDGYVDAGANIGACAMLMAAHNIPTVAFEPNPYNQFYLNQSIRANPSLPIKVFPYGLGFNEGSYPIFMEKHNAGNSVVGKAIHAESVSTGVIQIRKLDSFCDQFTSKSILLKIDVQGFEEELLKGAPSCLRNKIRAIKFEVASDWLFGQGSSPQNLFRTLRQHGFKVTRDEHGGHEFTETQFSELRGVTDAYAWARDVSI